VTLRAVLLALLLFVQPRTVDAEVPPRAPTATEKSGGDGQALPPPPRRTGARIFGVATAGLLGLGVFFGLEAQTARAHDINPTKDEQDRASIYSFATYVSFGLAAVSLIVATVLLLGESSATKP
jgi:hypothetical protein